MNLNNEFDYIVKSGAKVRFIYYNSNRVFTNYDYDISGMKMIVLADR